MLAHLDRDAFRESLRRQVERFTRRIVQEPKLHCPFAARQIESKDAYKGRFLGSDPQEMPDRLDIARVGGSHRVQKDCE